MRTSHLLISTGIAAVLVSSAAYAQTSTEDYTYDALGRLITVVTTGGSNDTETQSICYDDAGNRTDYVANTSAGATTCGAAPPPPPPPPPPPNSPPTTVQDFASGACSTTLTVNLTANDSDPESNYPLVLTGITKNAGAASASVVSSSSVSVTFGPLFDASNFTYTVEDSLGASSTGTLNLLTNSCGGGGPPPF